VLGFSVGTPFGLRDDVFSLIVSLPVVFHSAWIFFDGAWRALRSRTLDIMVLVAPGGGLRFVWTQLTSMRTALVPLFSLAVAAVPGSLVPQRKVSPFRVSDIIRQHPILGPAYDKVGLFHVYTSPWFSAIYLLLFISLVGCIIPRIGFYAKVLGNRPPKAPRNLGRLPAYAAVDVRQTNVVQERAAARLKRQRYRVVADDSSVSA